MDATSSHTPRTRVAALLFGLGSVLVAAVTAISLYWVLNGYQAQIKDARQSAELQTVLAASADLVPGKPIAEGDLVLMKVPVAGLPAGSTFAAAGELVGKVPAEHVLAGEVIRKEHLAEFAKKDSLATLVNPGDRAISVQTDHAAGVAGLVIPGDRVDVMVTIRPDSQALGADWVTETILQSARVLAVGPAVLGAPPPEPAGGKQNKAPANDAGAISVTLEVSPDDAEKVALAASRGELHLSLRNPEDRAVSPSKGPLITNALVGIRAPVPTAAPAATLPRAATHTAAPRTPPETPSEPSAEVIEGTRTSVQAFDASGRVVETGKRR